MALDKYEKDPCNKNISDGEWALGILLCESIREARKLAGDNPILKDVVSYMKKYSSNIDNLKFLDQQAELMKVFETDKLKAKEDGLKIGIDKGKTIGIDEGKVIGSDNKAIEIAKKMLSTDASIDYIAEMTGLSKEKINSLK